MRGCRRSGLLGSRRELWLRLRCFGFLLLVCEPGFSLVGGGLLLFLGGRVAAKSQGAVLGFAVGNLCRISGRGRQCIGLKTQLGLFGSLGAHAVSSLHRRRGRLKRIHRLIGSGGLLRQSSGVLDGTVGCSGQRFTRLLSITNLFFLARLLRRRRSCF